MHQVGPEAVVLVVSFEAEAEVGVADGTMVGIVAESVISTFETGIETTEAENVIATATARETGEIREISDFVAHLFRDNGRRHHQEIFEIVIVMARHL